MLALESWYSIKQLGGAPMCMIRTSYPELQMTML